MKVRDREDEMFTIHKDEQRAKLLVGAGYYLKRAIHDDPITHLSIQHYPFFYLSQAFDSSTKIAKRNFPNASAEELRVQIARNMNYLRMRGLEYGAKTKVDFMSQRDEK